MQTADGPSAHHVFASDISPSSRRWLRKNIQPEVLYNDIMKRSFSPSKICGMAEVGSVEHTGTAETTYVGPLDLYVAGFPCTPFSDKGRREGWEAEASGTFFAVARTIATLRPKAAILENVPGIIKTGCIHKVLDALRLIKGYTTRVRMLCSSHYFVPQNRRRVYIVMFRTDALQHADPQTAHNQVASVLQSCKSVSIAPFWQWLRYESDPFKENFEEPLETLTNACQCGVRMVCRVHPCFCKKCTVFGRKTKNCAWRQEIREYLLRPRNQVRVKQYLQNWRKVRKDPHLKQVPSYFQLAAKLGLKDTLATTQRERNILIALSTMHNLLNDKIVLDLSQSISRVALRTDGMVPTLTTDCSKMCVPKAATFLTPTQCCLLYTSPSPRD